MLKNQVSSLYLKKDFEEEVRGTLERGIDENHDVATILLEVNSLKFSYNKECIDSN